MPRSTEPLDMSLARRTASIKQALRANADPAAKAASQKFVPTSQNVYGVRVPVLNQLAREHREGGFELAVALWKAGSLEERLLAAKLLGISARTDPDKALALAKKFAPEISDWAVCDTVATQGLRGIAVAKQRELLAWSNRLARSRNLWERRLALVLLTHFVKDKNVRPQIKNTLARLSGDKEYYVRKAVQWLQRDLQK